MVKIGVIGVGTVGSSVVEILEANKEIISARAGKEIVVKKGVVKDLSRTKEGLSVPMSTNIDDILDDPEIEIVVELMGGVEKPFEVAKKSLQNGKAFVTANKAMLAYHRYELQEIAGDIPFGFEASVAGGIPVIKSLKDGLSANHIESIWGIINGTCNYILTKMTEEGYDYPEMLQEAQELGYAEADPTLDIGGFDAAHKILILASIAFGIEAGPDDIQIEGIEQITQEDIQFAKEFGYRIKHLGIANRVGQEVEIRVHPAFVQQHEMIAKVDGVMNGISIMGDKVGETMYYGPGAGGDATASAVISDIIEMVRMGKSSPMLGFKKPMEAGFRLMPRESVLTKYYLRIGVEDKTGMLARIAKILGENNISVETVLQRPAAERKANLLLSTHQSSEQAITRAIKEVELLPEVSSKVVMIRIEEYASSK